MLPFFRRHRGPFMIAITVIIIISFSYWGGSRRGAGLANMKEAHDTAFRLFGRDYSMHEMQRLARAQGLCYQLGMFELAFGLPDAAAQLRSTERNGPNYDFIANLLILREKAVEFGVAASDEEALKRMKTLRPFTNNGKEDENAAAEAYQRISSMGFSNDDMLQIVKDQIAYERLQDLIGANYTPASVTVSKGYAAAHQTLKVSTVTLALDDFKKKAEVKDDEISKYFEEKKDTYKTPEKRAAQYIVFEKPKADDKKKAEENAKAQTDFENLVNEFDQKFKAPGADLNALVAELQKKHAELKLQTVAAFERATPPEALKDETRVIEELFRPTLTAGQHSDPVDGTKGYYFIKVTSVDAPKQQELKDVKDKVKEALVSQKAQEALLKAANDARTALQAGLKAGKKLEELTKDKGWKVEALADFSPNNPPPALASLQEITKELNKIAAGDVTKPATNDTGAVLAVVTHKELRKSDSSASLKTSEETTQASQMKTELFKAWFGKVRTAANMRPVEG